MVPNAKAKLNKTKTERCPQDLAVQRLLLISVRTV